MDKGLAEYVRRARVACSTGQLPREQHLLAKVLQDWAADIAATGRQDTVELQRLQSLCCGTLKSTGVWLCTLKGADAFHCPLGLEKPGLGCP